MVPWSNISLFLPKTCIDCISSARKSYQEYSSDMFYTRGKFGKKTLWSQTMRNSEILAGRLNAKEVLTSKMMKTLHFRSQMEQSNYLKETRFLRTSTLIWDHPDRGEEQENLLGESDGCSPPFQNSSRDDGEARNDFSSISGNYIYRHHVEPLAKLYVPREESFQIPLRYIEVTRATSTTLDVMLERRQTIIEISTEPETFQNRVQDSNDSPSWKKNLHMGTHGPGERLIKKQTTSRSDYL